jgi:hypothetical protein
MNGLRVVIYALLLAATAWAQGYRLERNRLSVGANDWPEWVFPVGSVDFDAAGARPHFVLGQINATLDAGSFTHGDDEVKGGIRRAGTNLNSAPQVMDGLEHTFWEPDLDAPLRDWWVEIDLGRAVWAKKVVVRFAAEGAGDPFLQFKVLTSNGDPAFQQSESLNYVVAGRSKGLNKTQRVFEYDLRPFKIADPGLTGDLVQYIQIVATASDGRQGAEISQATWNDLAQDERGAVLYFRRETSGVLRQIEQEEYAAISNAQLQGPVRYYRRERPRLAEVEVWTVGENISLGWQERGGSIQGFGEVGGEGNAVDGDYATAWTAEAGFSISFGTGTTGSLDAVTKTLNRDLLWDLGVWYWIDRAFIVYGDATFPNYVLNLSDGSLAPDGSRVFTSLSARGRDDVTPSVGGEAWTGKEEPTNRPKGALPTNTFFQDNIFPPIKGRFFRFDYRVVTTGLIRSGIKELLLYGFGFLPQVALQSQIIELGANPRILSTISWEAETPPATQLQIRTRTGNRLTLDKHFFSSAGIEVSEPDYRKMLSFLRGDSTVAFVPDEADWSPWSQFYEQPGAAITSPSPRRYIMIETGLISDDPHQSALLRSLDIDLRDPLAHQILGEIEPARAQQSGQREEFTLFLTIPPEEGDISESLGFDQVLFELPPSAGVQIMDVTVGQESELEAGGGQVYQLDELGIETRSDSLWIRLPEVVRGEETKVALRFSSVFYLASNAFFVSVGLGEAEELVWQRVDAATGEGLTVLTPVGGGLVGDMQVLANPFTPNGDGINDAVRFVFPIFNMPGQTSLVLEVYGLDGALVHRSARSVLHAAGIQEVSWDGRDQNGTLLPPGMYVCRVGPDVDAETIDRPMVAKIVASVY